MNQPVRWLRQLMPAIAPITLYLFFFLMPVESTAQSVVVYFLDNESESIPVADINKMRVQGSYLRIYPENGPMLNYHLGTVARYEFDFTSNLPEEQSAFISGFKLFPNPTTNNVTALFELPQTTEVQLRLVDLQGRAILTENYGIQSRGEHLFELHPPDPSPGYYFVQVITEFGTAVEPLLITPLK